NNVWVSLVHPDVVDGEHVGMIERACRSRLLLEAPQLLVILNALGEKLDGNPAVEPDIAPGEDPAHSPSAELVFDHVPLVQSGSGVCRRTVSSGRWSQCRLDRGVYWRRLARRGARGHWRRLNLRTRNRNLLAHRSAPAPDAKPGGWYCSRERSHKRR